jgi:hypothetical protein
MALIREIITGNHVYILKCQTLTVMSYIEPFYFNYLLINKMYFDICADYLTMYYK